MTTYINLPTKRPDALREWAFDCADRAIRVHAVAALRAAGLTELWPDATTVRTAEEVAALRAAGLAQEAARLAALPPIRDAETAVAAYAGADIAARAAHSRAAAYRASAATWAADATRYDADDDDASYAASWAIVHTPGAGRASVARDLARIARAVGASRVARAADAYADAYAARAVHYAGVARVAYYASRAADAKEAERQRQSQRLAELVGLEDDADT